LRVLVGRALAQHRGHVELTQWEVAERADVSMKAPGNIECGRHNWTIDFLERVARVVGWDPAELFVYAEPIVSARVRELLVEWADDLHQRALVFRWWVRVMNTPDGMKQAATALRDANRREQQR
jgi:DNA-binding XRE family transcriptional regulator